MPDLINWDLIRNPYNWVIVILMLAIGVYALTLIAGPLGDIQTATMTVV
jgi:hypothetical protein